MARCQNPLFAANGEGWALAITKMAMSVNFVAFFLCFAAPKDKDKVALMLIELVNHRISKSFPSFASMGRGLPISNSQTAI